jgi:hypothetical protein
VALEGGCRGVGPPSHALGSTLAVKTKNKKAGGSGGGWQRSGVKLKYKRVAGGGAAAVHLKGV